MRCALRPLCRFLLCACTSAPVPWGLRSGLCAVSARVPRPQCIGACALASGFSCARALARCAMRFALRPWCRLSAHVPRPMCLGAGVPASVQSLRVCLGLCALGVPSPRPWPLGPGPQGPVPRSIWDLSFGTFPCIVLLGAPLISCFWVRPRPPSFLGPWAFAQPPARPRGPVARSHGRCPELLLLHALSIAERVGRRSVTTSVATRLGARGAPRLYWPRGPVARSRGRCPGLSLLHGLSIAVRVRGPFRPPRPWPLGPWRWGLCA